MKRAISLFLLMACVLSLSLNAQTTHILSQGWYTGLAPVDANTSDFRFVVEWVKAKTGLGVPSLIAEPMSMPITKLPSAFAPDVLKFTCANGNTAVVDAVMTFYHPEVSVVNIEQSCGQPLTYPGVYVKPSLPPPTMAPAPAPQALVGEPIGNTDGWYQPVAGDNSPDGTAFTDNRGTFVKVVVLNPFGKSQYWKLIKF